MTLTVNHDKMESEVNSLRSQLATEKSRFQKMQTDLQKELNVAFDENTKLTTLLDGKVPKSRLLVAVWILCAQYMNLDNIDKGFVKSRGIF